MKCTVLDGAHCEATEYSVAEKDFRSFSGCAIVRAQGAPEQHTAVFSEEFWRPNDSGEQIAVFSEVFWRPSGPE